MATRIVAMCLAITTTVLGVLLVRNQRVQAAQSTQATAQTQQTPTPLILEENDGEHRLRRPQGPVGSESVPEFIIKIDKLNGNAEDFYVGYEVLKPGGMIPFHKHHNSEEVVILEEGGATVTVGDKRSVTGPHAIVFIPRETWVSVANTGNSPHSSLRALLASRI